MPERRNLWASASFGACPVPPRGRGAFPAPVHIVDANIRRRHVDTGGAPGSRLAVSPAHGRSARRALPSMYRAPLHNRAPRAYAGHEFTRWRAAYTPASAARVVLIGYPDTGYPWLIGVFLYVGIVYLSTCLPRCARRVSGVYLWLSTVYPAMRHSVVMTDVPCSAHVMRPVAASSVSASRVCARRACVIPRDISMPVNLPSGRRLR